jgi:hypothetical protein
MEEYTSCETRKFKRWQNQPVRIEETTVVALGETVWQRAQGSLWDAGNILYVIPQAFTWVNVYMWKKINRATHLTFMFFSVFKLYLNIEMFITCPKKNSRLPIKTSVSYCKNLHIKKRLNSHYCCFLRAKNLEGRKKSICRASTMHCLWYYSFLGTESTGQGPSRFCFE